jgi:hypothetical protein
MAVIRPLNQSHIRGQWMRFTPLSDRRVSFIRADWNRLAWWSMFGVSKENTNLGSRFDSCRISASYGHGFGTQNRRESGIGGTMRRGAGSLGSPEHTTAGGRTDDRDPHRICQIQFSLQIHEGPCSRSPPDCLGHPKSGLDGVGPTIPPRNHSEEL